MLNRMRGVASIAWLALTSLVLAAAPIAAEAQTPPASVQNAAGIHVPVQASAIIDASGNQTCIVTNPCPVSGAMSNFPATVDTNSGAPGANTIRFVPATGSVIGITGNMPDTAASDFAATRANTANIVAPYAAAAAASFTRPANTTTYAAGQAWSTNTSTGTQLTFSNVCRANGKMSHTVHIEFIDYANQTLKLTGTLELFNVTVGTIPADAASFNVASADAANHIASIPFSPTTVLNQSSGASGITEADVLVPYQLACAAGGTSLFGLVQVTNAYIPVSGEKLAVAMNVVGDN